MCVCVCARAHACMYYAQPLFIAKTMKPLLKVVVLRLSRCVLSIPEIPHLVIHIREILLRVLCKRIPIIAVSVLELNTSEVFVTWGMCQ